MIYGIYAAIIIVNVILWRKIGIVSIIAAIIAALNIAAGLIFNSDTDNQGIEIILYHAPYLMLLTALTITQKNKNGRLNPKELKTLDLIYKLKTNTKPATAIPSTIVFCIFNSAFLIASGEEIISGQVGVLTSVMGLMATILSTIFVIQASLLKNKKASILCAGLIVGSYLFGPTRGGAIFPLLTYIIFHLEVNKLTTGQLKYDTKDFWQLSKFLIVAALLFGIISLQRFQLGTDVSSIAGNMLVRADTIHHFNNSNSINTKIERDAIDVISSTLLFWIPRFIYSEKPYLTNYEITKNYLGEEIASQATFNFGFGAISFIKDKAAIGTTIILELLFCLIYFFILLNRRTSLFMMVFFATSSYHIMTAFQTSFSDSPAQRAIIIGLAISWVTAKLIRSKIIFIPTKHSNTQAKTFNQNRRSITIEKVHTPS